MVESAQPAVVDLQRVARVSFISSVERFAPDVGEKEAVALIRG